MQNNDLISFSESRISFQNQSLGESQNSHLADIIFKVKYETQNDDEEVRVSGGIEQLGNWKPENGLRMSTTKETFPFWTTTKVITCTVDSEINYKYLAYNSKTKGWIWESNMSNRLLKIDTGGKIEIQEEKGNKQRKIEYNNNNEIEIVKDIENVIKNNDNLDISPINNDKIDFENEGGDNEFDLMESFKIFYNNIPFGSDILNYDKVKIEDIQNIPLTIGLKRQIEINQDEDKFIILTAILPFNIIKQNKNLINNSNLENDTKYSIIPKYEDVLYESLFRVREQKKYDIYWIGMLDNYEFFYKGDKEQKIDIELIEFLKKEKIYVVTPNMEDYINYWIYINHIIGKIFYENKIPVNDDFFINYDKYWDSYKTINELFSSIIFYEAKSSELIMIHDINLSLVTHFIVQKNNYAKMGFYFHSLFPSLEVFYSLPYHQELLYSILLCDLICFHNMNIAMKFLGAVQRTLDLYYEVKPGGNIIINNWGRIIQIHIMQIGINLEYSRQILNSKEFLENKEKYEKEYKSISKKIDKNEKVNIIESKNKNNQKENYIFFSYDGLLDKNNIFMKFHAFDFFYESYLKKINNLIEPDNMDKIIEENEEYINSGKNMIEIKPGKLELNKNFSSTNKNIVNSSLINTNNTKTENKDNSSIAQESTEIKIQENKVKAKDIFEDKKIEENKVKTKEISEDKKIEEKSKTAKNTNSNTAIKKKTKKIKIKKGKTKKTKSKSGINLSQRDKDIQIDLKQNKDIDKIFLTKEPIFIQILKDSESKIMNIYNYYDKETDEMKNNYKDIMNLANEINKKYNKLIIIVKRDSNFSLSKLFSLYSIGDCYYCLRKDYNTSIQIQLFIYICNYFNKTYDIILNENSFLSPGIKGVKKLNSTDIFQNISALEKVFSFNYINKYMNENNIKFINNNEILNWSKIFFSKLKKIYLTENCQKIVMGLGLGFYLMKLRGNFVHLNKKEFIKNYHESNRKLIFLDYENIIQLFNKDNKENVLNQLKILSSKEKNKIYIISGCKKGKLDEIFGGITNIGLACEYGFFYKKPGENKFENDYHQLFKMNDWSWKKGILPILKGFTERTEGSYIIEKESMISWVYKNCDPDFGPIQANEMISHIKELLIQNDTIIVADENETVTIRPKNINKGYFISEILKEEYKNDEFPDFILVMGDQDGDEEMFKYLNYLKTNFKFGFRELSIYTVTIGKIVSNANFFLNEPEILEFFENLNEEIKNDQNSSSKYSQELCNLVEQSEDDIYSKKEPSFLDY